MGEFSQIEICRRIARVRMEFAGPRGKSSFSKQLGLSPSTYDYYEAARVPPADVLVRIADLAGVNLRWLLTGEEIEGNNLPAVPAGHPAVLRAAELIGQHPEAAKPLAAFLDILAATMEFPDSDTAGQTKANNANKTASLAGASSRIPSAGPNDKPASAAVSETIPPEPTTKPQPTVADQPGEDWIPVLGRSAAGVPHFWTKPGQGEKVTTLGDLMDRHVAEIAARAEHTPATQSPAGDAGPEAIRPVQLIRLPEPLTETGPTEYVSAGAIKRKFPDAFAVWIDGESMSPEIRHGDLVLLSPSAPAEAGQAAVVQLEGAIGVTCKLYHPSGRNVHLVPINDQFPPATAEASHLQWCLRVLARIRLAGK